MIERRKGKGRERRNGWGGWGERDEGEEVEKEGKKCFAY